MIKTYEYTKPMNNVSHVLMGNGGNSVRFNFINGNIITKKLPECTLRGKYYQDLLESSDLFKQGYVRLVRKITEPSDLKENPTPTPAPTPSTQTDVISVESVVSEADLLAFVNEKDGREGNREFRNPSKALEWASEHNYAFPNYKP